MAAGDTLRRITASDSLILDAAGNLIGVKNPNAGGTDLRFDGKLNTWPVALNAAAGAATVSLRYLGAPSYSTFDTSSFRQIFQVPFTGLIAVRAVYENDVTATSTIDNTAFAAGRTFTDDNPLDALGAAATWQVVTATAMSAASASFTTDGVYGSGRTGWVLLNIPAPTDGGTGGYVYVGTKLNAGTNTCNVGNAGRPTSDWGTTVSGILTGMKYRTLFRSGFDYVTTAQNSMTGATQNSFFNPVASLDILPVGRALAGAAFGDSTIQGLGTGTPSVQPYNYNITHIAAATLQQKLGIPVHIANCGAEGKTSVFFLKRLETLLADDDFRPNFIVIQPFSVNDGTFSQSLVNAGILKSLQLAQTARKKGIVPIFTTALPSSVTDATSDGVRKVANAAIKASGFLVLDRDLMVTDGATPARIQSALTYDGTHLNRTGNELCAAALVSLLGIV